MRRFTLVVTHGMAYLDGKTHLDFLYLKSLCYQISLLEGLTHVACELKSTQP